MNPMEEHGFVQHSDLGKFTDIAKYLGRYLPTCLLLHYMGG